MSLDNAKKSIIILGVLNIIFGILGIVMGVAFLSGGNMLGKNVIETAAPAAEGAANALTMSGIMLALTMSGIMLVLGVFVLVAAVVDLLLGIFSIIGGKNPVKIMPAYVLSIIAIILSVVTMILNFANGVNVSTILDGIVGIVFSVTSFACARTIRNSL